MNLLAINVKIAIDIASTVNYTFKIKNLKSIIRNAKNKKFLLLFTMTTMTINNNEIKLPRINIVAGDRSNIIKNISCKTVLEIGLKHSLLCLSLISYCSIFLYF